MQAILSASVLAYPTKLACDRELEPNGEEIMSKVPLIDPVHTMVVRHDHSGLVVHEYTPGDVLLVSMTDHKGLAQYRASGGARFDGSKHVEVHSCVEPDFGMRNSALLIGQMPLNTANARGPVSIWAGWAEKQGQVYVTQKYVLRCRLANGEDCPTPSWPIEQDHMGPDALFPPALPSPFAPPSTPPVPRIPGGARFGAETYYFYGPEGRDSEADTQPPSSPGFVRKGGRSHVHAPPPPPSSRVSSDGPQSLGSSGDAALADAAPVGSGSAGSASVALVTSLAAGAAGAGVTLLLFVAASAACYRRRGGSSSLHRQRRAVRTDGAALQPRAAHDVGAVNEAPRMLLATREFSQ